jgi:hypothetical protein
MMVPDASSAPTQLVRPREEAAEVETHAGPAELQRMSLTVLRADWSTLAVVATDPRTPAWEIANALVDAARAYRLGAVRAVNGRGAAAAEVTRLMEPLAGPNGTEVRTVIAVDDPLANPACMPLVVAADAVLLLVRLGSSRSSSVEAMTELVGQERVVGCVVFPK